MFEFDFSRPVVAASEFAAGERVVRAGEVFDWRAHGMTEVEIVPLVRAGIVRQLTLSKVGIFVVSPGETVRVETPSQRDARRNKRR